MLPCKVSESYFRFINSTVWVKFRGAYFNWNCSMSINFLGRKVEIVFVTNSAWWKNSLWIKCSSYRLDFLQFFGISKICVYQFNAYSIEHIYHLITTLITQKIQLLSEHLNCGLQFLLNYCLLIYINLFLSFYWITRSSFFKSP